MRLSVLGEGPSRESEGRYALGAMEAAVPAQHSVRIIDDTDHGFQFIQFRATRPLLSIRGNAQCAMRREHPLRRAALLGYIRGAYADVRRTRKNPASSR